MIDKFNRINVPIYIYIYYIKQVLQRNAKQILILLITFYIMYKAINNNKCYQSEKGP